MLRHRLAALFEPRSLLILSSRELPVVRTPPALLKGRIADVRIGDDGRWQMPGRLDFLQEDQRLDMALLCLDPAHLPAALGALKQHRPRALVLLPHPTPADDPHSSTGAARRGWRALAGGHHRRYERR